MAWLPTLYKARGVPPKQPVCAICVDRTRGRTARLDLGFAVSVWLCGEHGSNAYLERNGGRDLAFTLQRIWEACACLTVPRERALAAHLARVRSVSVLRRRPGPYAWPALPHEAGRAFRRGVPRDAVVRRGMRRWNRERHRLAPAARGSP